MSNSIQTLFSLPDHQTVNTAPILLVSGKLFLKEASGYVFVLLKFAHFHHAYMQEMSLLIHCKNQKGIEFHQANAFYRLDSIPKNVPFGGDIVIEVPKETVSISVELDSLLMNHFVHEGNQDMKYQSLFRPHDVTRQEALPVHLIDYLKRKYKYRLEELNRPSNFIATTELYNAPIESSGIYYCVCGQINNVGNDKCVNSNCQLLESAVHELLDTKNLDQTIALFDQEDAAFQLKEAERIQLLKTRNLKLAKRGLIVSAIAAVIVTIGLSGFWLVQNQIVPRLEYNSAVDSATNGNYVEAVEKLELLGDFLDTKELVFEYDQAAVAQFIDAADELMLNGEFNEARNQYRVLSEYLTNRIADIRANQSLLDSSFDGFSFYFDQKNKESKLISDSYYNEMQYEFESKNYNQTLFLINLHRGSWGLYPVTTFDQESNYQLGLLAFENNEFAKARTFFSRYPSYKNQLSLMFDVNYLDMVRLYESNTVSELHYIQILNLADTIKNYKDTPDIQKETTYRLGSLFFSNKDFDNASTRFLSILSYKDSNELYNESTYQSAALNFSNRSYAAAATRFKELGTYKDSLTRFSESQYQFALATYTQGDIQTAIDLLNTVRSHKDASSLISQYTRYLQMLALVDQSLAASNSISYGLLTNGRVLAVGQDVSGNGLMAVTDLRDIISIATSNNRFIALSSARSMITVGRGAAFTTTERSAISGWTNLRSIAVSDNIVIASTLNGRVVATTRLTTFTPQRPNPTTVSSWSDVVQVAAGETFTAGLRKDGSVIVAGQISQSQTSSWRDVISIKAGASHLVALRNDGTLYAVLVEESFDYNHTNIDTWTNIISIGVGQNHTIGVRSDGTVNAEGYSGTSVVSSDFENIVEVTGGQYHTLGLKRTGAVVSTIPVRPSSSFGSTSVNYGQNNVASWSGIKVN